MVTELLKPSGLPKAKTSWPWRTSWYLPKGNEGNPLPSILSKAKSVSGCTPIMRASMVVVPGANGGIGGRLMFSDENKMTRNFTAPCTTCALVMIYPSRVHNKAGTQKALVAANQGGCRMPVGHFSSGSYPVTRICTTAGETWRTSDTTDVSRPRSVSWWAGFAP